MNKIDKYGKWMHNIQSQKEQRVQSPLVDSYLTAGWVMGRLEKVCAQVSKTLTGKKQPEETCKKRSISLTGRIITQEHRDKIGRGNSGKVRSEKTIEKLKLGHKHRDPQSYTGGCWKGTLSVEAELYRREKIKNNSARLSGSNHPLWKGGLSSLDKMIRRLSEYISWREFIFERDNYTCRDCGSRSGNGKIIYLEAHHHIKKFSVLLREFLQQYPQFSPVEDKETLVRLAITYAPFWDRTNGKTLCKKCHSKHTGIDMTKTNKEN